MRDLHSSGLLIDLKFPRRTCHGYVGSRIRIGTNSLVERTYLCNTWLCRRVKQVERRSTIKIRGVGKGKMIGNGERIERMGMAEREMKRYRYNRENQTNERGDNDEVWYKSEMFFKKKTTRDEKFMLILR